MAPNAPEAWGSTEELHQCRRASGQSPIIVCKAAAPEQLPQKSSPAILDQVVPQQKSSKWFSRLTNKLPFVSLRGKRSSAVKEPTTEMQKESLAIADCSGLRTAADAAPVEATSSSSSSAIVPIVNDSEAPTDELLAIVDKAPLQPSFEKKLRDTFAPSAPPTPWAPLAAFGTTAGYPAAQPPSTWHGMEPMPMELMPSASDEEPMEEDEGQQPRLPTNATASFNEELSTMLQELEVAVQRPIHRPRSYRTRTPRAAPPCPFVNEADEQLELADEQLPAHLSMPALDFKECNTEGYSSFKECNIVGEEVIQMELPFQKALKGGNLAISISSRPTTAGGSSGGSSGANSRCTSASRTNPHSRCTSASRTPAAGRTPAAPSWTPANRSSEPRPAALMQPLPTKGLKKPPPLPPLPAKPPESGSVRSMNDMTGMQPVVGEAAVPSSPAATDGDFRRIMGLGNANIAQPPSGTRKKGIERAASRQGRQTADDTEAAGDAIAGFDESKRGNSFSDLALAFTAMEVA